MRRSSLGADPDALASEQVDAHADYVPMAMLGTAGVAALLVVTVWGAASGPRLAAWGALLTLPFTWRFALRARWRRGSPPQDAARLLRQFRLSFALHGSIWGLVSVWLFPGDDFTLQALIAFIIGGLTATSLTAAAFDLTAGLYFLFLSIAPLGLRMFVVGGPASSTLGPMLTLYLGFMTVHALRLHRRYVETFMLRREAAVRAQAMTTLQAAFGRLWQADAGDTSTLLAAAARETAVALRLSRVVLCQFDHTAHRVRVLTAAGPGVTDAPAADWPLDHLAPYEQALASATPLDRRAPHAENVWRLLDGSPLAHTALAERIDVPMRVGARVEGVLTCERPTGAWTEDETAFLTSVAATVLAAIEDARRRDAERALRELNLDLERRIDERTRALRVSEARLAQTLEATNDGMWDFDITTGGVFFSPVWGRLLGLAPDALPASVDAFLALVHPDDRAALDQVVGDHLAGRRPDKDLEVRLRTASGEYRWFHDHGRIVEWNADGSPRRMLGTISDVTERRRMVDALHESEARFRALVDKSPVIFTLVNLTTGEIVEMNAVGLELFGYRKDEVLGRTVLDLGLWVDDAQRRRAARQIRDHGVVSTIETELRRKSGDTFWALLSGARVTLQGQPYALATLQDITERRELEARVLQSQKMEVVGHLAGGIAHDFNNVLTVIASMAELGIEDTPPGEPAREALQTIRQASTRASSLTRQLLAFSRRQVLQPAPVDLNDMVAAIEPIVRHAVSEKIDVRLRCSPGPAVVHADRNSLDQVVLNLAINARDAMPDGGTLEIAVGAAVVETHPDRLSDLGPGRYVTLALSDTGIGMTEATRRRVFEPFFTTKDAGKGTGLGLSVAHGIITQSGGHIEVDSTLGAGTTFTIYLPEAAAARETAAVPAGDVAKGRGRVLVVDDDADIRNVLGRALTFAGYETLAAGNGVEALDVLAGIPAPVDLLLTDVMMPAMGGQELARHVRVRYPSTRILFTSGYAENAIARHGVLDEGVDFIAKPYSLQALAAKVREVLERPVVN